MRQYYCPTHGKVTEERFEYAQLHQDISAYATKIVNCEFCHAWYYKLRKKKAKRPGES